MLYIFSVSFITYSKYFEMDVIPNEYQNLNMFSGNVTLENLSQDLLRNRFICSKHFNNEDLMFTRLPSTAVPVKYNDIDDDPIEQSSTVDAPKFSPVTIKTYPSRKFPSTSNSSLPDLEDILTEDKENTLLEDRSWVSQLIELPLVMNHGRKSSVDQENKKLKEELRNARKKINNLTTQLKQAKKRLLAQASGISPYDTKHISEFSQALIQMQLKTKKRKLWLPNEKKTAIAIFYKGPATYKFLRRKGVILPAVSTIKKWLQNFSCYPGFNKKFFHILLQKSQTMLPFEKKCIVLFDEMALKKTLEYNRKSDIIEGFEDLGELGRRPVPATQTLVLMIRGIYSQWKLPIAYFVSQNGVTEESLFSIITKCLEHLKVCGFDPIGITCDLSRTNQKFFKKLGVTVDQPYFYMHDVKYYALFDVPHLLKCVRNNFIDNDFKLQDKYIKFSDIKKIYDLDIHSSTGRSLPKLTESHLNPNSFEKMNVKLATQLFSHSVAAAIKTAVVTGEITSSTAMDTANFVEVMNNLFDALNSTCLRSKKPCNKVFCEKNSKVLEAINVGYDIMKNLRKISRQGKETRPDSFDGFLITINAVTELAADQRKEGFHYLFTGRLSQDPLENQFSVYRQKGGYNRNPTVRSFRAAFKMNIVHNLMRPPKSANAGTNYDEDKNILNTEDPLIMMNICETFQINSESEDPQYCLPIVSLGNSSDSSEVSVGPVHVDKCATVYFAGYLTKKCFALFKCEECIRLLESSEDIVTNDEILIFFKNYGLSNVGALRYPSKIMKDVTEMAMKCFNKYIEMYLTEKIHLNIKNHIITKLQSDQPEWFENRSICEKHRNYILDLLIRTLIFKYCKFRSSFIKTKPRTKNIKLSILQNQ